jgi:aryl-alcohol dehydrogenase-like predicted oxidoreductase
MQKRLLGRTEISTAPVIFGGNIFGWTVDEARSFDLLDKFVEAGYNTVDTADMYSTWAPGNKGGESETIIGKWLKSRRNRGKVVIITKGGAPMGPGKKGLSAAYLEEALDASLKRLQVEAVDVYLSHFPDPEVPFEETLETYQRQIKKGKIRCIGASNLDAAQLRQSLDVANRESLPRYEVLQPLYNLYDRGQYENELKPLCQSEGVGVITYYSLAKGFLSGKYRSEGDLAQSPRGGGVKAYMNERGMRILKALDQVAERYSARPAEVALAWLIGRPGVIAPIASATTPEQLDELVKAGSLALDAEAMELLEKASA